MKRLLCSLLILLASPTLKAEEPFVHAETGISLPTSIAGLERGQIQTYEAVPGTAGVAIPFHGKEMEVTVFIRPNEPGEQSTAQSIVDGSLAIANQMEKDGALTDLRIIPGAKGPENPQWAKAAYTARQEGGLLISMVYGTVKEGFAVKVRISMPQLDKKTVPAFINELQQIVNTAKPKPKT